MNEKTIKLLDGKEGHSMKVWIVSNGEPLPVDQGGPRLRRMGMLAAALQAEGHSVDWFCSTFHHYQKYQRAESDREITVAENYRIQLLHTPGYPAGVSLARLRYQKIMGERFGQKATTLPKPDVVLATLAPLPLSRAAVAYGKEHRVPVLVDIRDLWPEMYREMVPKAAKVLIEPYISHCRRQLAQTLQEAEGLWGVTEAFLDYGLKTAGRKIRATDRVFATAYPDWDRVQAGSSFAKYWASYGLQPNDFLVVFLGSFSQQFALDPVLEAAELLKDEPSIRWVLGGDGALWEEIKKKAAHLKQVVFPGWLDREAIHSLLSCSSAGVAPYIPSRNFIDNAPNKFSEYLSAGLPVLVSIPGAMENLLIEAGAGTRYHDGGELARQIHALLGNPAQRRQMGEGARRLFEARFQAEQMLPAMISHLQQVAGMK